MHQGDAGMDIEPEALTNREITNGIADLTKLHEMIGDLTEKMAIVEDRYCTNPEFIRRSIASIYDSQAVLTKILLRVMATLRDGVAGDDGPQEPHEPGPSGRPHLRVVEPD